MRVVSVVNQKGGVAKTATCANLGACLAARGRRTLLIDLDPQANLTLGLGRGWDDLPYRLLDVLLDWETAPLAGMIRKLDQLPLYLIPGHLELVQCEAALLLHQKSAYHLRCALEALERSHEFDWVVIDCPPSLGLLTQSAIVSSRYLLVPTEPKMYAFAGMDILNRMIVELAKEYSFQAELLGVLLTMVERGTRLHRTISSVIRDRFGEKVFQTVIYKNVRLSEAEIEGKPVVLLDPRAPSARNYEGLTTEVLARAGE